MSSRDFSGPYGPDPRGADELSGDAWRDRPGYGAGDYGRRSRGYDQAAEYDTAPARGWGGRDGGGEYGGGSRRGGAHSPREERYGRRHAAHSPREEGYGRRHAAYSPGDDRHWQDDPGRDTQVLHRRQARQDYDGGSGRRSASYGGGRGGPPGPGGPGGPGGRRGPGRGGVKAAGSWWRHWTWRKALGVAGTVVGGLVLAGVTGVGVAYAGTPIPTDVSQAALQQQSVVYFSNGTTVLGTFGTTNRQLLTYNQIPRVVRDAILSAEDRSFYTEGGVSPRGILRAAYEDVFHGGGSGGNLQGGSTITQEFVRNYYAGIGRQQTITRKLKEIFVALKVARQKSKSWILTQYLNTIYFGNGAYGVQAAAETYFGEPALKLDVAQAAMIAAMIQLPSYYSTPAGHQALVARWHYVLGGMVKMGDLTAAQAAAEKFPKVVSAGDQSPSSAPYAPYVMQMVSNELESRYHYTQAQIDNKGLRVVTTVNQSMTNELYSAVKQNEQLMNAGGVPLPAYAHVGAELQDPKTGAILAVYPGPGQNLPAGECVKVACDLNTLLTREQVGSSFKPYVLSAAVKQGMNVKTGTTMLDGDSPLWIPPDTLPMAYASTTPKASSYYMVHNAPGDGSLGAVSVLKATAMSLNTAYTDLWHRVGGQNVANMASQYGVNTKASGLDGMLNEAGMALGQASLSLNEQATMLATIDDNGMYHDAHVIQQITQNTPQGKQVIPARVTTRQVLTPAQDSEITYAMSADTSSIGTAPQAAMSDGRPIIGKTGTTNTAQSAFFLGAIPQYSLAVAIFSNKQNGLNQETLGNLGGTVEGGYGGWWPAKIWRTFAEAEFLPLPVKQFPTPVFSGQAWIMVPNYSPTPAHTPTPTLTPTRHAAPPSRKPKSRPGRLRSPVPSPTVGCGGLSGGCPSPGSSSPGSLSGSPSPGSSSPGHGHG